MSKKFEICSATYTIALNHHEDDVFRTGCTHLYHFLHGNGYNGRSTERKPMTLGIHLELNELIEETEGQIAEPSNSNNPERQFIQQLEAKFQSLEDSLQANSVDTINKLIERMEKLEKNFTNTFIIEATDVGNNTIDHESNNALLNISDHFLRQSDKQLEEKLKTLEDALQAKDDLANKIIERLEKKLENIVHKATDIGNNTINHETNNALLNSYEKAPKQSVQQLEAKLKTLEDSLQANNVEAINKIIERMEKFEKSLSNIIDNKLADGINTIAQEINNALLRISDNSPIQSPLQLEAKLKTSEDSPQANIVDAVNKLIERMDRMFENNLSNNIVNKTPDVGNNKIDHETNNALLSSSVNDPRQSVQQFEKEIKDLKDRIEQLELNKAVNETADIGNPTIHDNSTDKQQQQKEIQFDTDNLIKIRSIKSSDSSLETAIHNVIQYAKKMDLSLTRDQIKHVDVRILNQGTLTYLVFFRTRTIKETFLMKSDILERSPHYLTILNVSEYNSVFIRNFKSTDLSKDSAIVTVIGLAKQMGLTLMRDQIIGLVMFRVNQNCLVCHVEFSTTQVRDEFVKKSHILKGLPETKSLEIY